MILEAPLELHQPGHRADARPAPGGPEVQHDDLAPIIGEPHRLAREVGGLDLGSRPAAQPAAGPAVEWKNGEIDRAVAGSLLGVPDPPYGLEAKFDLVPARGQPDL